MSLNRFHPLALLRSVVRYILWRWFCMSELMIFRRDFCEFRLRFSNAISASFDCDLLNAICTIIDTILNSLQSANESLCWFARYLYSWTTECAVKVCCLQLSIVGIGSSCLSVNFLFCFHDALMNDLNTIVVLTVMKQCLIVWIFKWVLILHDSMHMHAVCGWHFSFNTFCEICNITGNDSFWIDLPLQHSL